MPKRCSIGKVAGFTPLRRSPRLLQMKHPPPGTPNPRSRNNHVYPISESYLSSSSPRSRKKFSNNFPESLSKGSRGSTNGEKSRCGSKRASRLTNKVNSLDGVLICHENCNGFSHCNLNSKSGSKQVILGLTDNVGLHNFVASPVTPLGVGEKKSRGDTERDNDSATSDSVAQHLGNFERRITRSRSRQAGGKIEEDKRRESDLFKHDNILSKKRVNKTSSDVRPCDEVKGIIESGSCKNLAGRIEKISCDAHSLCVTSGGRLGRQDTLDDNSENHRNSDDLCGQIVGNSGRRITRSVSRLMGSLERRITRSTSQIMGSSKRRTSPGASKRVGDKQDLCEQIDCGKQIVDELEKLSCDALSLGNKTGGGQIQDISKERKMVGVKRKRKQVGIQGTVQGWTKEQEAALQKAYFTAKPSPNFWKKVAKLVPGKSAQECFNKVHSDNLTPIPTRTLSRAKRWNSPCDLGTELFKSAEKKSKKPCRSKKKSHVARRTVRHLLHKYCHANQDSKADLFSILEPMVNPSVEAFHLNALQSTPEHQLRSPGSLSGHKKRLSRFSGNSESPLTSPPVLKKVKNLALHEKYIDQLHTREAKRKVAYKGHVKDSVLMKDVIRAAKNALVSDARDVINKYRDSQANIMEEISDQDEVFNNDDDEDESLL